MEIVYNCVKRGVFVADKPTIEDFKRMFAGVFKFSTWPEWSKTTYNAGDRVNLDDSAYESAIDNNSAQPGSGTPMPNFNGMVIDIRTNTSGSSPSFGLKLGCAGTFHIEWGDGATTDRTIASPSIYGTTVSHNYSEDGEYQVKITGAATGYNPWGSSSVIGAISFNITHARKMISMYGDITELFPRLGDNEGQFPRFNSMVEDYGWLLEIADLKHSALGKYEHHMFYRTFKEASLKQLPKRLFVSLAGAVPNSCFEECFYATDNTQIDSLADTIPSGFFGNINGTIGKQAFYNTFCNRNQLFGKIPELLFGHITDIENTTQYDGGLAQVFWSCNNLSDISGPLFEFDHDGELNSAVFYRMFCVSRPLDAQNRTSTSTMVKVNGTVVPLYSIATGTTTNGCFLNNVRLSDYAEIPSDWK